MNYKDIIFEDCVNGDGIRATLFVSGCSLRCPNCHNQELQDQNIGQPFTKQTYTKLRNEIRKPWIDGLTLSGGHPLEDYNRADCTKLCQSLKEELPDKTIWLYTGYKYEDIQHYEIINYVDVVVDGSYIEALRDTSLKWRGSSNQRVIDVKKSKKQNRIVLYCD